MAKTRIAWDETLSAAANARLRLPELVGEYFGEGRRLAAGDPGPAEFHAFRLRTKRWRYTLEMFRSIYGASLDRHLAALRRAQTFLGDLNDCAVTRVLILRTMPAASPQRRRIERYLDERAAALRAAFLSYWRGEFDAAGEEARWRAYLSRRRRGEAKRPAPRVRRSPPPPSGPQ